VSLMPESAHMLMWIMSDRAIPRSFRFMEGFGVHTFRLVNADGRSTFVKFHWKPKLGLQSVVWNEALKISGADPDFHRRDLWDTITAGDFPEWELGLQLFDDDFADRFAFDVLDPTKIIPEEELPVRRVGRLVLDRVVDNFFAETEQVAFCTQNVVPGIDFTNDPLLQGRNFSYLDTQLKRLGGPNFTQLPVNAPKCPVAHFQQDGHMAMVNPQGRVNYEPNSWDPPGPREDPVAGFRTYPDGRGDQSGPKRRLRPESFADHYSQARQFFISQTETEQQHIIDAFVFELSKCDRETIRTRMVAGLRNVGDDLAGPVAEGLGLPGLPDPLPAAREPVRDLPASTALSILANGPDSFAGRKIGILVTDGVDAAKLGEVKTAAEQAEVNVELIAPAIGGVDDSEGNHAPADQKIDGGPSVLYDAVILLAAKHGTPALAAQPAVRDFVADAYAHCKFIGYTGDASPLFEAAGLGGLTDDGFVSLDEHSATDFISRCAELRFWPRQASIAQRAAAPKASAGQD
jgi:catalase